MKAWLGDAMRTVGALWYWNARKSWFVLRRRRGQCPCHNPSDSGEPGKTGCEAVTLWNDPARFQRRVCPLLQRNADGVWMCGASVAQVRPFWGRFLILHGAVVVLAVLLTGFTVFGAMRHIGYHVSLKQIFWPPRWSEFRELRVQLFAEQAKAHYEAGRVREAIAALAMAHALAPENYAYAMMLAQFYQAGVPEATDAMYRKLMQMHPERRNDTARVWFRSLLARARFKDLAELARRQLASDPTQTAAWLHALLFASRAMQDWTPLEAAATDAAIDPAVRRALELELAVRRLPAERARDFLRTAGAVTDLPYLRVQRVELFIEFGAPNEALALAASSRFLLSGRDVVRLGLAARAAAGQRDALRRDIEALLAPEREVSLAEISLVAQHLIRYPDRDALGLLREAMPRLSQAEPAVRLEAWINFFCAAGSAQDRAQLAFARERLLSLDLLSPAGVQRLETFFTLLPAQQRPEFLLPQLQPFALDLSYALCGRYLQ